MEPEKEQPPPPPQASEPEFDAEHVDLSDGRRMLFKRVLRAGVGDEVPACGCRVRVHYVGTLLADGAEFDSSRGRGDAPFEFALGKGQVIRAWDDGVATMRRGELAALSCHPDYAYGAAGSPPKIPPHAWLRFEVEMLDWKGEDLSPKKNEGIVRYCIAAGEGYERPDDGALVDVELVGRLQGAAEPFESRSVRFNLGEGSEFGVVPGVERALEKFNAGEKSRLVVQPKYAFGRGGNEALGVPPDAVVEYTVALRSFERADVNSDDCEYVMRQGNAFKNKGTDYFKALKYPLAVKMYKRAISFFSKEDLDGEEKPEERKALLLSSHLNLSLCYLKLTPLQPFDARDSAVEALKLDPNNVKGLFRKGQALQAMGECAEAIQSFQRVVELEPENKAAANQIIICKATIKKQNDKEKKLYANMFEKFAKKDIEAERLWAKTEPDVMCETLGEWGAGPPAEWADTDRDRAPTDFEKENPNILMLDKEGQFVNM